MDEFTEITDAMVMNELDEASGLAVVTNRANTTREAIGMATMAIVGALRANTMALLSGDTITAELASTEIEEGK